MLEDEALNDWPRKQIQLEARRPLLCLSKYPWDGKADVALTCLVRPTTYVAEVDKHGNFSFGPVEFSRASTMVSDLFCHGTVRFSERKALAQIFITKQG